jgi:hypothetical protein
MTHEKLKAAFLQGGERESSGVFNELIRGSVREAFWQMMAEEVEALCGPHYRPDKSSEYRRAGSEIGSVYLGGDKEEIRRPRVRHRDDGEKALETYRAASSQTGLFEKIVGLVGEGMSQRGAARSSKGTISKSAVSRMWEDKSREQLALVRERPLDQVTVGVCQQFLTKEGGRSESSEFPGVRIYLPLLGSLSTLPTISLLVGWLRTRRDDCWAKPQRIRDTLSVAGLVFCCPHLFLWELLVSHC